MSVDIEEWEDDVIIVSLPYVDNILSEHGVEFIEEVSNIIAPMCERADLSILFILSEKKTSGSLYDSWLEELESQLLLMQLSERIKKYRHFIKIIKSSAATTFFAFDCNCCDWKFDVALSCDFRLSFNPEAIVGFEEIELGVFPPGWRVGQLSSKLQKYKNQWKNFPVLKSEDAAAKNLLQFSGFHSNWQEFLKKWMRTQVVQSAVKKAKNTSNRSKGYRNIENRISDSTLTSFSELKKKVESWEQVNLKNEEHYSGWDVCWKIAESKFANLNFNEIESLFVYHLAKQYFYPSYMRLIRAQKDKKNNPRYKIQEQIDDLPLYLNVDTVPPPVSVVASLIKNGKKVIFFASDFRHLTPALERYFIKLESSFPDKSKMHLLWEEKISWFTGDIVKDSSVVLSWQFDDTLHIKMGNNVLVLNCLAGNLFNAEISVCETNSDNIDLVDVPAIKGVLPILTSALVRSKPITGTSVPVSIWLRSLLFEELLQVAAYMKVSFENVLKALQESNWGFIAMEDCWSRFLQMRYSAWSSLDKSDDLIQNFGPNQESWDIANWKQMKSLPMKQQYHELSWNQASHTIVNHHFAVYCGLLARLLERMNLVGSIFDANILCSGAAGFPHMYGEPTHYLDELGEKRVAAYCKIYWPVYYEKTLFKSNLIYERRKG
ncbi:MAG: hypothetical protein R3B45_00880 [Bdellovibrionota bacterium]